MKLSSHPITGTVISFDTKKRYGWLKPSQPVSLIPSGKVFIHVKDLVGITSLEKDQEVKFDLYEDNKGVGAMNCSNNEGGSDDGMEGFEHLMIRDELQEQQQNFEEGIPDGMTDDPMAVIAIYVENMHIGGIIGKGGATIKKMNKESGAKIDITKDEGHDDPSKKRDPARCRLINLSGTTTQLKKVTKAIAQTLTELSQSLYSKITLLIHQSQAGRLIGKGGVNIKKIRGDKRTVNVNISKEPVEVNGEPLVTVSIFGPCKDVEESLDEMVDVLAEIYQQMLQNYTQEQDQELAQQQMQRFDTQMGGGYGHHDGGYGGGHQDRGYGGDIITRGYGGGRGGGFGRQGHHEQFY